MTEHEQQEQQQQHEDEHEHDDDVEHGDANNDCEVSLPFDVTVGVISMIQQDWWLDHPDALSEAEAVLSWEELHVERRTVGPVNGPTRTALDDVRRGSGHRPWHLPHLRLRGRRHPLLGRAACRATDGRAGQRTDQNSA